MSKRCFRFFHVLAVSEVVILPMKGFHIKEMRSAAPSHTLVIMIGHLRDRIP